MSSCLLTDFDIRGFYHVVPFQVAFMIFVEITDLTKPTFEVKDTELCTQLMNTINQQKAKYKQQLFLLFLRYVVLNYVVTHLTLLANLPLPIVTLTCYLIHLYVTFSQFNYTFTISIISYCMIFFNHPVKIISTSLYIQVMHILMTSVPRLEANRLSFLLLAIWVEHLVMI
jgi:hypothetical protein